MLLSFFYLYYDRKVKRCQEVGEGVCVCVCGGGGGGSSMPIMLSVLTSF